MRIGLLTPAWPGTRTANGIATAVRHLARGFEATGSEVTILARQIDASHEDARVVPVTRSPWRFGEKLRARFGTAEAVSQAAIARAIAEAAQTAIREHGIEVLVMEETQGWAGPVAAALPIPVVVTLHGPWLLHKAVQSRETSAGDRAREAREAAGLVAAAGITAPSRGVLAATEAALTLPDRPRAVIANPVPCPSQRDHEAPPGSVLFVGRFDHHKGGDVMIDAFARLAETHPDSHLTFAGPDRGVVRTGQADLTMAEALSGLRGEVRARIDAPGQVDQEKIAALRQSHAIAVMASRYEIFGYTLFEAMAAGQAVVATRTGGPADMLTDGENGLLVPPGDAEALAAGIARLIADPALARRLGANARRLAETRLSPEAIATEMLGFFGRLQEPF